MDVAAVRPSQAIDLTAERPFQVGGAAIDPLSRDANFAGGTERVQPQNLKVLIALVRAKGQVVTREQLVDLCWDGRFIGDDVINRAISTLRQFSERAGGFSIETVPRAGYRLFERSRPTKTSARRWAMAALASLVLAGAGAWLLLGPARSHTPTLAIQPSSATAAAAARELGIKLASMEATNLYGFRLLRPGASESSPDLILQVGDTQTGEGSKRDLSLVRGKDQSILWAAHFQRPGPQAEALADQAGIAASLAISCAFEAFSEQADRLNSETLRLYISGCARLAGESDETSATLSPVFEQVIQRVPQFAPAWDKLLYAEALGTQWDPDPVLLESLRRHLEASHKVGIDVASVAMAEAALLPPRSYGAKIAALTRGLRRHPRAASLELDLANALMNVGRHNAAIFAASSAADHDRLSPVIRGEYIRILAHSGRIEDARRQLEIAQRLWPEAADLQEVRLSYEVRYGDPRAALELIRSGPTLGGSAPLIAFAQARIEPTKTNVEQAILVPEKFYRQVPEGFSALLQAQAQFGRTDDAIATLLYLEPDRAVAVGTEPLFRPMMHQVWRDPRFIKAMARLGLVAYWAESGRWPDFCFDPQLPYDCKKEAARYSG
jgi:DNA-binding winged helix-turn-helix (wHTH) protein/tetratricopeptide (TPR) repeat protein